MKKTILLVDDDKSVRDSLSKALRSEDYSVVVAANGQEAIDKFDDGIDIILLDLMMPVITGWNTYELITALNPLVPVVVITAATNQYQQQQAAGMVALFQKPVEIPVLLRTMEQLLAEDGETRLRRQQSYRSYFRFTHPFVSGLTNAAVSNESASMPMNGSTHPSEARDPSPAENREFAPVQPYPRWGINE